MDSIDGLGRLLVIGGVMLAVVGLVLIVAPNIPFLGRLPGDTRIDNENVKVFVPLGTMLLLSLILTVVLNLLNRR
jgi:uncharacterized membrane protein